MSVLTIMATASSTATTPRQATFVPVDLATKLTQMIHERAEVCMATYSMHVFSKLAGFFVVYLHVFAAPA